VHVVAELRMHEHPFRGDDPLPKKVRRAKVLVIAYHMQHRSGITARATTRRDQQQFGFRRHSVRIQAQCEDTGVGRGTVPSVGSTSICEGCGRVQNVRTSGDD
jgi:hypothetical protein